MFNSILFYSNILCLYMEQAVTSVDHAFSTLSMDLSDRDEGISTRIRFRFKKPISKAQAVTMV